MLEMGYSISLLIMLIGFLIFMFWKLNNINKSNIILFLILSMLWISFGLFSILNYSGLKPWENAIIIASPQLFQAIFRLPLGKLSQKIRSRKVPILLSFIIMLISSVPLIFSVSFLSLFSLSFGLGVFGATFGMQNQYWSENWDIKNVFVTSGLIITSFFIGKYFGHIVNITIDQMQHHHMKNILFGTISFSVIVIIIYTIFHKEDKNTILLDNKSDYAKHVSEMTFKDVMIFSSMIFLTSFSINLIENAHLVMFKNSKILSISINSITIICSLITAFILIRFIKERLIEVISIIVMLLGITFMIISSFTIHSRMMSYLSLCISVIGFSCYTMNMFGMILHVDHKNSLLVLGIWLTFKSLGTGMGQLTATLVSEYSSKYNFVLVGAITGISFSAIISMVFYKNHTIPAYDLIENIEFGDNYFKENSNKVVK